MACALHKYLHRSYCAQQAHSQHLELNEKAEELLKQLGLSEAAAELADCNKVMLAVHILMLAGPATCAGQPIAPRY
jgi:hypothetical protein